MWRVAWVLLAGCSLLAEKTRPFEPLEIQVRAEAPAPQPTTKVIVTATKIDIHDKVQFQVNSATILQVSYSLLDDVARVMTQNPQIELVQVEGHTDAQGSVAGNRQLSQQRAESVVQYLIGQGVDARRLVAKGFGPDKPIGDNNTEEGREQNRRVEFNILKQGVRQ